MTNYFTNCKTQEELKATYKELVKTYHPDIYGEKGNDILKEIHAQLEKAVRNIDKNFFNDYIESDSNENEETKTKKQELVKEALKYTFPEGVLFALYWENRIKPYNHRNPLTKHNFTGWNIWSLEIEMVLKGYNKPEWSTFNQYKDNNNSITKGEHGKKITLAIISKGKDEDEEQETKSKVYYKGYTVFNIAQTQNGATSEELKAIPEVKQIETKLSLDAEKIEKAKESHNEVKQLFNDIAEQKTLNLWDSVAVVA